MRESKLVRLWEGKMDLPNLKYIDLYGSNKLMGTPDFSSIPNLETLKLEFCKNLVEIHQSIAVLKRLKSLRLYGCESIKSLPSEFEMDALEFLSLDDCYNLKKIPEFGEQMKNLWWIHLNRTAIEEIPSSIGHLVGLEQLHLRDCKNLKKIPKFGEQMKNLKEINLAGTAIEEIPSSIGHLVGLEQLQLANCKNLKKIPEFGEQMKNLKRIYLSSTAIEDIPSSIGHLVGLKELNLYNCKNFLNLPMAICSLKSLEHLVIGRSDEGSDAKARDGCGLLRCIGLEKSRPNPPRWGLVLSSLNRLCSLRELTLRNCELSEGDIPDDIGCLSFLERLDLSGNNFVSLPESIRCLSKLCSLDLERCKSLQELAPLPSEGYLWVNVRNCTSLKRLLDTSKMMSRYLCDDSELCCYDFFCLNNTALAQDWLLRLLDPSNTILTILRFATKGFSVCAQEIIIPGSEIPGWFSNQSVGHSVNVDLPPPSCTDWLGIAFCFVFEHPKQYLANPAALPHCDEFHIRCSVKSIYLRDKIGFLMSEHLWVFYLDHSRCLQERFLFETYFSGIQGSEVKVDLNMVKKYGFRLVYKHDLE